MPPQLESPTEDMDEISERDRSIHWKIKAISAKITYRIFSKYAQTKFVEEGPELEFKKYFQETYGEMLLESHL